MINTLLWNIENGLGNLSNIELKKFNLYTLKFKFPAGKNLFPNIIKIFHKNVILSMRYDKGNNIQYIYIFPLQNPIPVTMVIIGIGGIAAIGLSIALLREIRETSGLVFAGIGAYIYTLYKRK